MQYCIRSQWSERSTVDAIDLQLKLNHPRQGQKTQEAMMTLIEWSAHLSYSSCLLKCHAWGI